MARRRLIVLGGGSIATGYVAFLSKQFPNKWSEITVIAEHLGHPDTHSYATVREMSLSRGSVAAQLDPFVNPGDFVVNVTVSVNTEEVILFCRARGVLYIDTSNEVWPGTQKMATYERRHSVLTHCRTSRQGAPTALICHGANPGLVTHFLKHALEKVAESCFPDLLEAYADSPRLWGEICRLAGIDRIDISEIDTQSGTESREADVGYNTWSVEGLLEESFEPSCFPYAEAAAPLSGDTWRVQKVDSFGTPLNVATSLNRSIENSLETWVPSAGWFQGLLIPHPEQFSMASLCAWNDAAIAGHPTVRFVYAPCPVAGQLLERKLKGGLPKLRFKVLMEEIESGADMLGITLFLNDGRVFWYGSVLGIDTARSIGGLNNATTLQVVAGIHAGTEYVLRNATAGLLEPEDLDHKMVLAYAKPFLGNLIEAWGNCDTSIHRAAHLRLARASAEHLATPA